MKLSTHFRKANVALRRAGVDYWAACGTMLGITRERRLLPHDPDIDFGTFDWTHHDAIARSFLDGGYEMKTLGLPNYGYEQCFFWKGEHVADVFYFYPQGMRKAWQASYAPRLQRSRFEIALLIPTRPGELDGVKTRLPNDPEGMCEARYGPEWRETVKTWDYSRDPYCLVNR